MNKILQDKKFQTLFLLILTAIVLFFLLKDNFFQVINEIFQMNIWWILLTVVLIFGFWLFKAIGSNIFVRQIKPNFKLEDSLKISLVAQFFNSITPFALGGHPMQVHMFRKYQISITEGTNITIQNFIVYQIAVVIIQIISIIIAFYTNLFGSNHLVKILVIIGLALDFFIIFILFVLAFSKKIKYFLINIGIKILTKFKIVKNEKETLDKWYNKIDNFHINATKLFSNKKAFVKAILCNFIGLLALYLTPLTILYATGNYTNFNAIQSIYIVSCIIMAADLVPTPGQLGGIEYGFSTLFGGFTTAPVLAAIVIVWRFLSYYLALIIGAIALNVKKKQSL